VVVLGSTRRGPETLSLASQKQKERESDASGNYTDCIIIQKLTISSKENRLWLRTTWRYLWQTKIAPPPRGWFMPIPMN